jgi:3',5'-cyclic AMP phosphodiesterase CpdA
MRIAHLSDVHLFSLEGARVADFLNKRWSGGLNLLVNRGQKYRADVFDALVADLNAQGLDHVACTGDITNLALPGEFKYARERFDRFTLGPEEVTCIPGNHDNYVAEGRGLFEEAFAPYCEPDAGWEWGGGARWPIVRVRGEVALIGLSTSVPTTYLMGYGMLGGEQLRRLEQVLGDPRLARRFRLVMLHHPAAGRYAESRRRGLHDHGAFAEVVKRVGAELVIHGHEHQDLHHSLPGPGGKVVPVEGIQAGSYGGSRERLRARYRVYEIAQRGGERPEVVGVTMRGWMGEGFAAAG